MLKITDENFEDVMASHSPVLIDFMASWCGPCKVLKGNLEAIAEDFKDRITFASCDIDEALNLAVKYNIRSVPTMIFFKDGQMVKRHTGAMKPLELAELIAGVIEECKD